MAVPVEQEVQPLVSNPYQPQPPLPFSLLNIVQRIAILGASLYGLHAMQVYHHILSSPKINHEWFKAGLACCVGKCLQTDSFFMHPQPLLIPYVMHWTFIYHTYNSHDRTALLSIKAYIEMYAGKLKKQTVNYKTFPQSTHAILLLLLLTTVCFHAALIPHFGWGNTFVVLNVFGFGILLPFALLVPTYVQNLVAVVLMTWFLQEYS